MGPEPRPGEVVCQVPVLVRILGTDISIIRWLVWKVDILPVKERKSRITQGVSGIGEIVPAEVRELSLYRCFGRIQALTGIQSLVGIQSSLDYLWGTVFLGIWGHIIVYNFYPLSGFRRVPVYNFKKHLRPPLRLHCSKRDGQPAPAVFLPVWCLLVDSETIFSAGNIGGK